MVKWKYGHKRIGKILKMYKFIDFFLFLLYIIGKEYKESKESKGELMNNNFIKNAKISKKGQVTIPKEIRSILQVNSGDYITFGINNKNIIIVNRKEVEIKNKEGNYNV